MAATEPALRLPTDAELDFVMGVMVVLILLPTVIWLAVVLLRRRE